MVPTLEDAIAFAALKHAGQRDKAGKPYILHPLRVMPLHNNLLVALVPRANHADLAFEKRRAGPGAGTGGSGR